MDAYDPDTDSWSTGPPLVTARRNFATDTDGNDNIWVTGGYDTSRFPTALKPIFNCLDSACAATPEQGGHEKFQRQHRGETHGNCNGNHATRDAWNCSNPTLPFASAVSVGGIRSFFRELRRSAVARA